VEQIAGEDTIGAGALGAHRSDEELLDAIVERAAHWSAQELVEATLGLCQSSTGADLCVLFRIVDDRVQCLGSRPRHLENPLATDQSSEWFPWNLRNVHTNCYVFVPDASRLAATPTTTLGDLGFSSVTHLPLLAPDQRRGALHLLWREPRISWDDAWGAQLRALGSFVVLRTA
jgi:hypothetical protein